MDAEWVGSPSDSDVRQVHDYMRKVRSERGEIEEFSAADQSLVQHRPESANDDSSRPAMLVYP